MVWPARFSVLMTVDAMSLISPWDHWFLTGQFLLPKYESISSITFGSNALFARLPQLPTARQKRRAQSVGTIGML